MYIKAIPIVFLFISCHAYHPNILHPQSRSLISLKNYDSASRPPGLESPSDPVRVSINLFVRNIEKIEQAKNEYTAQVTFRAVWNDPRLKYEANDSFSVSTNDIHTFWKPDVFFSNEKDAYLHNVAVPNSFARIYPDGQILLSSRFTLVLNCPMDLWPFPFDKQDCKLRLASYGYTEEDVILTWRADDPVQTTTEPIPGYKLLGFDTAECKSVTNTGAYSCLQIMFHFKRVSFAFVIRLYIPLFLLVVASWSSFCLPISASQQRLTIGAITTISTALLLFRENDLMRLPALTTMDVWVAISACFVFGAFFEYILAVYLDSREKLLVVADDVEGHVKAKKILWITIPEGKAPIDVISKVAFPMGYVIFHLICGPLLFW